MLIVCIGIPFAIVIGLRATPDTTTAPPKVSYAELVSILLTGVTIVLAIGAVFLGALAIWGYQSIKQEAVTAAKTSADAAIQERTELVVDKAVEAAVDKAVRGQMKSIAGKIRREIKRNDQRTDDLMYPAAFSQHPTEGEPSGPVADEYPDGAQNQ